MYKNSISLMQMLKMKVGVLLLFPNYKKKKNCTKKKNDNEVDHSMNEFCTHPLVYINL